MFTCIISTVYLGLQENQGGERLHVNRTGKSTQTRLYLYNIADVSEAVEESSIQLNLILKKANEIVGSVCDFISQLIDLFW